MECPIKLETQDGEYLGMCPNDVTDDYICPVHGDVELACGRLYDTGYATSERYHEDQRQKRDQPPRLDRGLVKAGYAGLFGTVQQELGSSFRRLVAVSHC